MDDSAQPGNRSCPGCRLLDVGRPWCGAGKSDTLVRLQQRGWIAAKWGLSDNNRKAKFYSITKSGQKQLAQDTAYWQRLSGVVGRVLAMQGEGDER